MANEAPLPLLTIGVVADTHVPDRRQDLHPKLIPVLETAGVSTILHAGDISDPAVLAALSRVAPVKAVMGNRDWRIASLPMVVRLTLAGVPLVLTHGHGGWLGYIRSKIEYLNNGYHFEYYHKQLRRRFPEARVVVFGHTHRVENRLVDGCLFFNPGAAYACLENDQQPHVGLLSFYPEGRVEGRIINLDVQ